MVQAQLRWRPTEKLCSLLNWSVDSRGKTLILTSPNACQKFFGASERCVSCGETDRSLRNSVHRLFFCFLKDKVPVAPAPQATILQNFKPWSLLPSPTRPPSALQTRRNSPLNTDEQQVLLSSFFIVIISVNNRSKARSQAAANETLAGKAVSNPSWWYLRGTISSDLRLSSVLQIPQREKSLITAIISYTYNTQMPARCCFI